MSEKVKGLEGLGLLSYIVAEFNHMDFYRKDNACYIVQSPQSYHLLTMTSLTGLTASTNCRLYG